MIEVGRIDDFPERSVTVLDAGGVEIGVVRWDGDDVYALRNVCPHDRGPVCRGRLGPRLSAAQGDPLRLEVDDRHPVLACAWHGWEFDVRSGRALCAGERYRVRTYPTRVEDGRVLVDVGAGRRAAAQSAAERG